MRIIATAVLIPWLLLIGFGDMPDAELFVWPPAVAYRRKGYLKWIGRLAGLGFQVAFRDISIGGVILKIF